MACASRSMYFAVSGSSGGSEGLSGVDVALDSAGISEALEGLGEAVSEVFMMASDINTEKRLEAQVVVGEFAALVVVEWRTHFAFVL
jgi:hypothetical protein